MKHTQNDINSGMNDIIKELGESHNRKFIVDAQEFKKERMKLLAKYNALKKINDSKLTDEQVYHKNCLALNYKFLHAIENLALEDYVIEVLDNTKELNYYLHKKKSFFCEIVRSSIYQNESEDIDEII